MKDLADIKLLTYLNVNNPWNWKSNITNILNQSSKVEFFQIYNEICLAFSVSINVCDSTFRKYFEDIFHKRVIDPDIEIKKFGERGEGFADYFFTERVRVHNQNLEDMRQIYVQWKAIGIERGFAVSSYPDDLLEFWA